ncbi:hypothetical protein AURDEDRAFT_113660 [Auricularia subglabra TFB-10046 SS5]|nr:hypothetical protein AURDEDRAFT_113660 [Auricularia subglabra TFB-10046 SS5]
MTTGTYKLLNSSSDELLAEEVTLREQPLTDVKRSSKVGLSDILVFFALIASLVSFGLSLSLLRAAPQTPPAPTGVLRRPNAYIGLEKVTFPANATFDPIVNYPLATFQIETRDKRRKLKEADRQFLTVEGVVNPEDHRVLISRTDNTVIQFRARDWGMENCVLHLAVAPGSPSGTVIDIWDLGSGAELLPHISWATAPPRVGDKPMATARLGVGETVPFHCPQSSFPTFELACADANCFVDFWQDLERGPDAGIHIRQHWSRGATSKGN